MESQFPAGFIPGMPSGITILSPDITPDNAETICIDNSEVLS
jgi:hypothetical protein